MRFVSAYQRNYPYCPSRLTGFERYQNTCADFTLFCGIQDYSQVGRYTTSPVVFFDLEEPNRFIVPDQSRDTFASQCRLILSVCPYTVEWQRSRGYPVPYEWVFFPFDETTIPSPMDKVFDVIWTGHIFPQMVPILQTFQNFKSAIVTGSQTQITMPNISVFRNVEHSEKLTLTALSKVSVIKNHITLRPEDVAVIKATPELKSHPAFIPVLDGMKVPKIPQIKARTFEAAMCRALILCERDEFNIIERYFEPEKEFVYFEEGQFSEKMAEVLGNYEKYKSVTEHAYSRMINNYTTFAFVNRYLRNIRVDRNVRK